MEWMWWTTRWVPSRDQPSVTPCRSREVHSEVHCVRREEKRSRVSQNKTFAEEREGDYLWAPKGNKDGHTYHHWAAMEQVRAGDVILSFVSQAIAAVSVAKGSAYASDRPFTSKEGAVWEKEGWRVDAEYENLTPPIPIPPIASELRKLLPPKYSPLTREGTGVQGYLFQLPDAAANLILGKAGTPDATKDPIGEAISRLPLDETTRKALIESRVGQGRFRQDLLTLWGDRCAVTGLAVKALLKASHMKPWRASNNAERLDAYNGLLLAPSYDCAFDAGLISFSENGQLQISPRLDGAAIAALGLNPAAALRVVKEAHRPYLAYHRQKVFSSGTE